MNHLDFLLIGAILIVLPCTNHAFYDLNPLNITVVRNISCRTDSSGTLENNFQLCAIRLYHDRINTSNSSYSVFDGLRYTNTFRRFIQKYCSLWPISNETIVDVGSAACRSNPAFENFEEAQLCICATDNCNSNWDACHNSTELNNNVPSLPDFMPDLNVTINCSDVTDAPNICLEHHYVLPAICQEYVKKNSVMCAITVAGTGATKTSLIEENYEAYLDEKIYQIRSTFIINRDLCGESDSNAYCSYSNNDINSIKDCACTSSLCNQDYNTCVSSVPLSSATTTSVVTSERGFNSAATAGIACGIIFSAVIFTAEIVILKFFYKGGQARGAERSVAYRA